MTDKYGLQRLPIHWLNKTSRHLVIFINRQRTNILIRLKLLIGWTNRTDWQTYWYIILDSELPFLYFIISCMLRTNRQTDKQTPTIIYIDKSNFWDAGNFSSHTKRVKNITNGWSARQTLEVWLLSQQKVKY